MLKKIQFILVLLALASTQSLYSDCYIQEENLYSLADGELTYDNYSNVLYLQNEANSVNGPQLVDESSVSFFLQTDSQINLKTRIFSYRDENTDSPLLQLFVDGRNLFVQTGEKETNQRFDIDTNTWYNFLISIRNSKIEIYVNYKYFNFYNLQFQRNSTGNLTYSFGEDNFSGYLYEVKLIQNQELNQFNIMCIFSNQCNPRLRPENVSYSWFNNQCKNTQCVEQNNLLQSPKKIIVNPKSVYDQKTGKLNVSIELDQTKVTPECLSFSYSQYNNKRRQYTYIKNKGTFNSVKFQQSLQELENNGSIYVSYNRQQEEITLNYRIQLYFAGNSHLTLKIPVSLELDQIKAQVKLQSDSQNYQIINKSDSIELETDVIAYNGILKLMTDKSFKYELPPFYQYPQNYDGKFYVQWQFQRDAIPRNLFFEKATVQDKNDYILQNLDVCDYYEYENYRNYVFQTSHPLSLRNENEYYIVMIFKFNKLSSGTKKEDLEMRVPIKVFDDQIISY